MENKSTTEMLLQLVCSINRDRHLTFIDDAEAIVRIAQKQLEAILEYRYKKEKRND